MAAGAVACCTLFKAGSRKAPRMTNCPDIHVVGASEETESVGSAFPITATRVADENAHGVHCMVAC